MDLALPQAKPCFAICLSGSLRTFSLVVWTLKHRLIHPTEQAGGHIDLFIHVWSDGSHLERAGEASIYSLPEVQGAVVEPMADWQNRTSALFGWTTKHARDCAPQVCRPRWFNLKLASQWRKVYLSFMLAFQHSPSANYYTACVRTRPDLLYLVPFNLGEMGRILTYSATTLQN